jgi:CheY-like chemotaxis protein
LGNKKLHKEDDRFMDRQTYDNIQIRTARLLSIIGIAAYWFIWLMEIAAQGLNYRFALGISLCSGGTVVVLLVFMRFVKDNAKLAFYVPFITFVGFTAGSMYLKDFEYYFMIWLSICGTGCLYRNFKKLLSFFITSNVIIFFLFLFGFFFQSTNTILAQALTRWIFAILTSMFFLVTAKFSSEKERSAAEMTDASPTGIIPVAYDTSSLISHMVQLNLDRINSKLLAFVPEIDETLPSRLRGDEWRIKQIVNKLLSNAFKYTGEGKITLSIGWKNEGDMALLRFIVQDTGMGIKPEVMDRLFSVYSPLDTKADQSSAGTGLTLSLVKQLTDMMGGTVHAESEYGKGSIFTMTIPQEIISPQPIGKELAERLILSTTGKVPPVPSGDMVAIPHGKALMVDNGASNMEAIRELITSYGLSIDTVLNGREAIEKLRHETPGYAIIFMQHLMPEIDGMEITRIIRKEINTEYAKTVPIIALTAGLTGENEEMFLAGGFNALISKHIDLTHLDRLLRQWLGKQTAGGTQLSTTV